MPEKWKSQTKTHKELPDNGSNKTPIQKKQTSLLRIRRREKLDTTLKRLLSQLPNANEPLDASNLLQKSKRGHKK